MCGFYKCLENVDYDVWRNVIDNHVSFCKTLYHCRRYKKGEMVGIPSELTLSNHGIGCYPSTKPSFLQMLSPLVKKIQTHIKTQFPSIFQKMVKKTETSFTIFESLFSMIVACKNSESELHYDSRDNFLSWILILNGNCQLYVPQLRISVLLQKGSLVGLRTKLYHQIVGPHDSIIFIQKTINKTNTKKAKTFVTDIISSKHWSINQ